MKKQITIISLLLTIVSYCQTITYQSSNVSIANPERGFYHLIDTGIPSYSFLSPSQLANYINSENITTIQRGFYLKQFRTTQISSTYLSNMQTDFNTARNSGIKLIVRFAYSKDETDTIKQPIKSLILSHISQLAPILESNKDVISMIQLGFIGVWGESYTTSSTEFGTGDYTAYSDLQYANRKEVIDACINQFPQEIPLQLRYIYSKTKIYGDNYVGRIGFFNDAFLNVWGDQGTYLVSGVNGSNVTQQNYLALQTSNLPMSGETDGINSPRTDCTNAQFELDKYNWSLLNKDYLTSNITNWQTNGCYADIDKKLGYRFELINSTLDNVGNLTINLHNIGYANVFKNRKAYIVLKNTVTNAEYSIGVEPFVENWITNQTTTITSNLNNLPNVPHGAYKLYLNIPDLLINNSKYSIQCANLGTWNSTLGYNDLLQTFNYQKLSVTCFDGIITVNNSNSPIKVYDLLGKLISKNKDISNFKKGIYIVIVNEKSFKIIR